MTTDTGANGAAAATIDAPPPPPQAPPTTDLARPQRVAIQSGARGLELRGFEEMWKFALAVQRSGLAPKGVQTPEAILVALQMGAEVGLSPMAALQNTAVINGRPSLFGDAQLAVVRGSGLFVEEEFDEWYSDGQGHRLPETAPFKAGMVSHTKLARRGCKPVERTFTYDDAQAAKLLGKPGPWQEYPKRMLRWRSRGYALRDVFTDVLRGIPSAEEVRDRAELTDVVEGAIVIPSDRRGMSELGQQLERLRQQQTTPPAAGTSSTEAPAAPQSQPADTPAGTTGATATDPEPPSPAPDRPAADLKRDAENQWSEFIDSQWTIAQQKGSARGDFDNAVKKALVRVGKVRKAHETDDQFRALLARDVAEATGPFEYLNQIPAQ